MSKNGFEILDLAAIYEKDLRVIDSNYLLTIGMEHKKGWIGKVICQACDEVFDTLSMAFSHYRDSSIRCFREEVAQPQVMWGSIFPSVSYSYTLCEIAVANHRLAK